MGTPRQPARKRPAKGRATRSRRQAQSELEQPSRSQLQAMAARDRAVILPSEEPAATADDRPERTERKARGQAAERLRPSTLRPTISRAQEFAYIRADMRRLLVTAGPLLLLMIALLFVIDR